MESSFADELESWLESATATQFCENCQKLSKTIKNRETVLKKLKSRIILTDKIIKQFQLKKNELSQAQHQLALVTEKLKTSEKFSQTLQSKVAGLRNSDLLEQAKKNSEKRLAAKELTIKALEEQLKATESGQKIFKDSSAVSLKETEKLRDENKHQAKVMQSMESNQKRKIQQLERSKKEIDENKKCIKSLEKEISQLKEKNAAFFQILLVNRLLPKKELQAMNRRTKLQLNSVEDVPEVGIMSDDDDDDGDRVEEKKEVKRSLKIDVNSIFEEFRAFPKMLSPLPTDDEDELDASVDSSEKSVNDLAKLLELEFLQTSELPDQDADKNQTKVFQTVTPRNNSDLTVSSASSLTDVILKNPTAAEKSSLVEAPLKHSDSDMLKSVAAAVVDHLSSDIDGENKKTKSPFKSNPIEPALPNKRSSNGHCEKDLSKLSSDSDNDEEELKTSSHSIHSSCIALTNESPHPSHDSSLGCTSKNLDRKIQPESPKLCNPPPSSSILTVEKVKEQTLKDIPAGNPVETAVLHKQECGTNHRSNPLKSSVEMANSLDQTNAANTNLVEKDLNLGNHVTQTQLKSDMINMFGSEYLSSSDDDDSNTKSNEPRTCDDKVKNLSSVETNHENIPPENSTIEISPSIQADSQNPTTVINIKSEKISLEKSDDNSISFTEERLSKDIPSLNKETVENMSVNNSFDISAVDVRLKSADVQVSPEIICPISGSLETTKPTESMKILMGPPEKESAIKDLEESQKSAIDYKSPSEAGVDTTSQLETGVDTTSQLETGVDKTLGPETGVDTTSQLETGVDKTVGPETGVDTTSQSETGVDKTLGAETGVDTTSQSETGVDKTLGPETGVDTTSQLETGVDKTLGPETGVDTTSQSETSVDKTLGAETGVDTTSQSETGVDKTLGPETGVDTTSQSETGVDTTSQSETSVDKTLGPETGVDTTSQSETGVDKTLGPETGIDTTSQLETSIDTTSHSMMGVDKTLGPETGVDKTLGPETGVDKMLGPETDADKTLGPEMGADKTSQSESGVDKSLRPEMGADTTSQSETCIDKNHGTNHRSNPLKSSVEMANSLDQTNVANTNLVEKDLNLEKHVTQTQLKSDMINMFGSEYLSSSDDDDSNTKTNEPRTCGDKVKNLSSVETNHENIPPENSTIEISHSIQADSQNPSTVINIKSEKISLEKSDDNSISFTEERLSKDIPSLNKETVENISVNKSGCPQVEQNCAVNNPGTPNVLPEMHKTDLKNASETIPCLEKDPRNSNQSLGKSLPSSLEMVSGADHRETTLKEFNSFDVSAVDVRLKSADVQVSSEIICSISGSLETTKPTESMKIPMGSPEKESAIKDLEESQESAVDYKNRSETGVDKKSRSESGIGKMLRPETGVDKTLRPDTDIDKTLGPETGAAKTLEPDQIEISKLPITESRKETKKMSLNNLSDGSQEEEQNLKSAKNSMIKREILEGTMTRKSDKFEEKDQHLNSTKEKDQNAELDKSCRSLTQVDSKNSIIKVLALNELTTSTDQNLFDNKITNGNKTLSEINVQVNDDDDDAVASVDVCSSSTEELQTKTKEKSAIMKLSENVKDSENSSSLLVPVEIEPKPTHIQRKLSELSFSSTQKNSENGFVLDAPGRNLEITSSKEVSRNMSPETSAVAPIEKTQRQISEPISQNFDSSSADILGDGLQASISSTQSQHTNHPGGDKSVDSPKAPKKQDKMILSVENNTLAKKPKVLAETDMNKVDSAQLLPFQSAGCEKGSCDLDVMSDSADIPGHGGINSSTSSDKENNVKNMTDTSISNAMDPKKFNKADTVHKRSDGDPHFLQCKSAEIPDSQNMKNDTDLNGSQSLFERNEDAVGLVNDTENIPKRIGNGSISENGDSKILKDRSKLNTKTLRNFNKSLQSIELSESLKTDIEEIGGKLNSSGYLSEVSKNSEFLRNNLENGKEQNCFSKLSEDFEKSASIKINSVENGKELGIDIRLSESNTDFESLKNCLDDKRHNDFNQCSESRVTLGRLREKAEENGKELKDSIILSENIGNTESSRNGSEEINSKKLESSSTKVEIIEDSDCLKNGIKEIGENTQDSCGLIEDGENLDLPTPNSGECMKELASVGENVSCATEIDKNKDFGVCVIREENGNGKAGSENTSAKDDDDSLKRSVTGDSFSLEEFSDFESCEPAPILNSNYVSNVNINELFGDDDEEEEEEEEDRPNLESKETVRVPAQKNPTSSLSNGCVCRVNNADSCVDSINKSPVPLFVTKVVEEKDNLVSDLDNGKKQVQSDEFGYSKSCKKRKRNPVFRMAIAPKRLSKLGRKYDVNDDVLCKAKTEDSVIKPEKSPFIKFVAASGKVYLPTQLPDPSDHDISSPSIKEEKKVSLPADQTSKNSEPIPQNCLLSPKAVTDLSQNTDGLQPPNNSFSEQLFAREEEESKGSNSNDIFECIKEFILVTRPISPLPTTPEKSSRQLHDHSSPPPKRQTILNVSTPTTSNCDYLGDIRTLLNMNPQLSPIVTPRKLREKQSKKCLLKDFVPDEGTDVGANNVPRPLPKTIAADTDSGNEKNCCRRLPDADSSSSNPPQPKPNAAESNPTPRVDSSQSSADKKCLKSQQRLLRKSRSLRRICPPTTTSCAKNAKSDQVKETKKTKRKEVPPKTTATAQLPPSSSKPQKMDTSLETTPKAAVEELDPPTKEILDLVEPKKVSSLVDSDEGKKSVKPARKRKLDVKEGSTDKSPDGKKRCLKNDAILSRARASLMKVADREFQSYWKYVSSPASQVLQKLLHTNREAELIVEVVAIQAVKLLSSTTENMLPWYITRCKSNTVTPYLSDKEKHLLRLLCLFKKRKEMGNIFTKFRECLKEALTKEDCDSTSLGKWSLCRMFLAMCRLEGLLSEARVFFYASFCQLPCEQYITFAAITACTWPLVLSYDTKAGRISLFHVIEYAVLKSINEKPHNMKYFECLVKHCKWKPSGSNKNSDIQRSLFNHLHDCIDAGATKDEIFCYVKGVELLSLQGKWLWTVSLFRSRISQLLKKCLQVEPPEDRQHEFNCLLCYVFQMSGNLCMKSKKRHKVVSFVINSLLKPFLNSNKFSFEVHLCCARVLMQLYPFEPSVAYPILELWFQEKTLSSDEPSTSKLRNEWILLKSHLNKETGVT